MTDRIFAHEHPEFDALLSIVSEKRDVAAALVEKDYWVTHSLWALQETGLRIYFKGGTSLSKGFGLIERFSEDLDLKIESSELPVVSSWSSAGSRATGERRKFFRALQRKLHVPGAEVVELPELRDDSWRNAVFAVRYSSRASDRLPEGIRPFVQLEVGCARVTPGVDRPISSWVHDHLTERSPELLDRFRDNRPRAVHCVRPEVTLLEKVEAIARRYARDPFQPATFIRHYEDAARILANKTVADHAQLRELLEEMKDAGDIRAWPAHSDPCCNPDADIERSGELESAWTALEPLFWGPRISLRDSGRHIRDLLSALEG